ncbi:hypothetical protein [Nocardioides sp. P5_C9_2]
MSTPETTETPTRVEPTVEAGWWHRSHPTFAGITGFFAGMLLVTALPGGFAGVLRLMFSYERAQQLFPLVLVALVVPVVLLSRRKTRRFAIFMVIGMAVTALVVLGVTSLVLYFMVQYDVT